ncbi:hypothetical protein LINGRAHAP2_LOCUS14264 [Linum grandiflorum]
MDASSITDKDMTRNLQNVINETFGMPTPNEVRNEQPEKSSSGANSENRRARRPATRRILMESSTNDLASDILEIRPAIDRAVDAMVNRLLGEDENRNNMRHQIMIDLESLPDSPATRSLMLFLLSLEMRIITIWSYSTG